MTSAIQTIRQNRSNEFSKWKGDEFGARERIAKKICVPLGRQSFVSDPNSSFFAIGSCFARNVEERLSGEGANVLSAHLEMPSFGAETARVMGVFNKYNPYSILQELQFAANEFEFPEEGYLPSGDGGFYDAQLRVRSGIASIEELKERRHTIRSFFAQAFEADVVIITLGLIETWFDRQSGLFLTEAPNPRIMLKNEERFEFRRLTVAECQNALNEIYSLLKKYGKAGQKLVLTVSPVPMGRTFTSDDIIVANMTSKSTLRVAALEFIDSTGDIDYFPSYEAVLHSHPDLAWQDDRLHVSDFMVGNIIDEFLVRYGVKIGENGAREIEHEVSVDEKIIKKLNKELNSYKNKLVKLQSQIVREVQE